MWRVLVWLRVIEVIKIKLANDYKKLLIKGGINKYKVISNKTNKALNTILLIMYFPYAFTFIL